MTKTQVSTLVLNVEGHHYRVLAAALTVWNPKPYLISQENSLRTHGYPDTT